MSTIRLGAAVNVREFQSLVNALEIHPGQVVDSEALQDEFGRFRVWSGNLGVLQKGHSSLDYRLRDAPLLSTEVSKLLKELEENLHAAYDIVSGVRLPYEQQSRTISPEDEDADDSFFSEDEDVGSEPGAPKTELGMRFQEVVDIINHLYKISVRIRAPTVHTRSLKAASYQPKDPETGIDLFSQYAIFDHIHTQELVRHLRMPHAKPSEPTGENDDLVNRLARAVTLRRRQFKYWRRHRDKLGVSTVQDEPQAPPAVQRPEALDPLEAQPGTPGNAALPKQATSQRTGKTLLSGTEATHHEQSLDDIVDSKSVTSYAVTVKDLSGKGIDLPSPPKAADGGNDFECPYCFIICPARYGKGRPWKTHVLQDLQPYVCTYLECQASDRLFRSRRDWAEHESGHRKVWRCPEHPDAVYKSESGLEEHIRKRHEDSLLEDQIPSIVKVGETSTIDLRQKCPICCASVDMEGMGTLQNHIANHLERIAAFSIPVDIDDDDSGGGSSRASRGGTGSLGIATASRSSKDSDDSAYSDEKETGMDSQIDIDAMVSSTATDKPSQSTTAGFGFLSESLIRALPDDSGHRMDLLFSDHQDESDISDHVSDEEESVGESEAAIEKHMAEREAFRMYLLSLPGAQSVRFYKRYGSWNGNINFQDGDFATRAMESFDYPRVQLRREGAKKEILRFSVQHHQTKQVSFRTETVVVQPSPPHSVSSESDQASFHEDAGVSSPVLLVTDIPNLRSLYRSGKLVPRSDSSYVPDNRCNEIIAFCYHDITRLQVDAIVNSSNQALTPSRADWTLNNIIHKAAGPGLHAECSSFNRLLEVSQAVLTGGYQLPCTYIIHVARPKYASNKGMEQYNLLTEGYRNALRLAMRENLKTIAFCCLGTGGLGFSARIAARVALQEAREFLDAHPRHSFERIVFCVYTEDDSTSYTEHFPLFFPPTQQDLDNTIFSQGFESPARLSAMVQEVYTQVGNVSLKVAKFGTEATDMPQRMATELSSFAEMLKALEKFVSVNPSGSVLSRMKGYINLLCSVTIAVCENMTEMHELTEGRDLHDQARRNEIWDEYNNHMQTEEGLTVLELIDVCHEFAHHLNVILEQDVAVWDEAETIAFQLGVWLATNAREGPQSIRNHFEEVMLRGKFRRDAPVSHRTGTVKLYQIPNLTQLYQQGALQVTDMQAKFSARSNDTICFMKDDIIRLEVDIIVNSTDTQFSGLGGLDRSVILRGGKRLQEECDNHAPCKEGEVILTGGYDLPAKHVLHAITPADYRTDALDVLRDMYRKILHMASYLKATSVAIPSLGTGMLGYPRRNTAAVAIEEVKRFLEFEDESNPIEKIVFVVFSSNDEYVYRSLLSAYFPPNDLTTDQSERTRSSPKPISSGSRTLFGTVGEALRKLAPGKQLVFNSRSLEPSEEDMLIAFEKHAQGCPTCSNISEIYSKGEDLCDDGYRLAAQILRHIHMQANQAVYPLQSVEDFPVEVEIPDIFPLSLELLHTVEKSFRDPDRDRPFVSNQPSLGSRKRIPEYTVYNIKVTVSGFHHSQQAFDRIYIWSDSSKGRQNFKAPVPTLHLARGELWIQPEGDDDVFRVPVRLSLSHGSVISVQTGTEIIVDGVNANEDIADKRHNQFTLSLQSQADCEMLLTRIMHAANNSPTSWKNQDQGMSGSSQTGQPTESDLPFVPTEDLVNTPKQPRLGLGRAATVDFVDAESGKEPLGWGATSHARRQSDIADMERLIGANDHPKTTGSAGSVTYIASASTLQDDGTTKGSTLGSPTEAENDNTDIFDITVQKPESVPLRRLESDIFSYVQARARKHASVSENELATRITAASRADIRIAIDFLRSFNLISAVPEHEQSWTTAITEPIEPVHEMQAPVQATSAPSVSSTSRDPLSRLIDPKLIPFEELDIEAYWEHVYRGDNFDDTTLYTQIDKRLVYEEVLREAGLEFREQGEWLVVFDMLGKEKVLKLHEETRKTHRFTPREHRWE